MRGYEERISTKEASWKISLLLIVVRRGGRVQRVFREERHCVPLHTRPPRIALVSNSAPALLLMARPGFRKAGFFSNREKLPQTSFFSVSFSFPFLFFPSFPPSLPDKLVYQHCVKKGYHWNTTSTELAGVTNQTCKRDSPSTTALPISYLSHEELKKEKKVETTIIVCWDHTKYGPKKSLVNSMPIHARCLPFGPWSATEVSKEWNVPYDWLKQDSLTILY